MHRFEFRNHPPTVMTRKPLKEIRVDIGGEEILIQIFSKLINFSHWKDGEERWATVQNDKGVRLYTPNSPSKDLWKPRIPVATVYFDYWQAHKKDILQFSIPLVGTQVMTSQKK